MILLFILLVTPADWITSSVSEPIPVDTHEIELTNESEPLVEKPEPALVSFVFEATAYIINDAGMDGKGITASGTQARPWFTVATDPKVIPMGTQLYIPALADSPSRGYTIAEDRGGAIQGHTLDICFPTQAEAFQFGRREITVYVMPSENQ